MPDAVPTTASNASPGTKQENAPQPPTPVVTIQTRPITKVLEAFLLEVDALANTLPLVLPLIQKSIVDASGEFNDFLRKRCISTDSGKTFTIPLDEYTNFVNVNRRLERVKKALEIMPQSLLTSLISHYDAFIGNLLREVLFMKPELLNSSNTQLSFKDLTSFTSMEAARRHVVDKEVDSMLRDSHAEQFKWMESKFGVALNKDLASWPTFIEVTERRNLFVHCNGVVSTQYLTVCKQHGVDCSKVQLNQQLRVTPQYFQEAYATVVEIGLKLAHVLWRHLKPEEMEQADVSLSNLCLDLIRDEKYVVAGTLLEFATQFKKFGTESNRRIFVLNKAQAFKWNGQDKKAKEIIAAEDWRASSELLQLGAIVLNDDFKRAAEIMKHLGPDRKPSKGDYKEWPIFKAFRASTEFADAYKAVFGEPFEITTDEATAKKDDTTASK